MRIARTLVVAFTLLLIPALVQSQGPGGMPGGFGGGRGGGRGGFDFDSMAKGKETIVIADLDGPQKFMMERAAQSLGITNGQMTREQLKQATDQFMSSFGGRGRGPGGPGGPTAPGVPGAAPSGTPPNYDAMADDMFDRLDRNRDGVLDSDEMTDALRSEVSKWDKNQNGLIEREEYKPYFAAYMAARQAERGGGTPTGPTSEGDEEDRRAVVFRAGKLPKDIPPWFAQLDTDADGQIGYYEWKKSGRTLKEFKEYDRNGDMFITIEEVMLVERMKNPNGTAVASSGAPGGPAMFNLPGGAGGMPDFAGMRQGRMNFGGPGGAPGGFGPGNFGGGRGAFDPAAFGGGRGNRGGTGGDVTGFPARGTGGDPAAGPGRNRGGRGGPGARGTDGSDGGDTGTPGPRGKNKNRG